MRDPQRKRGRRREKSDEESVESMVSSEALRGVFAILSVACAGFLILAGIGVAGKVGSLLFETLSWILGVGYMLLPLSLLLLAMIIFRSLEKTIGWVPLISISIFLFSSLGLIDIFFPESGGVLGSAVANPMVQAVDTIAAVIFLFAFIIAAVIIAFDVHLSILWERLRAFMNSAAPIGEDGSIEEVSVTGLQESDMADEEGVGEGQAESPEASVRSFEAKQGEQETLVRGAMAEGFPIIAAVKSTYTPPPASLLSKNRGKPEVGDVKANMNIIKRTLQNFGIQVEMDEASIGPTVTRYAMKPAEGVRLAKIVALQSNLELALATSPVRIEAPIPGKALVGIEVPNIARTTLGLGPLVSDGGFIASDRPLLVALGRSITGQPHFADLARMPHMLVAGATGAGKSVAIHDFIISLLYRCGPDRLRLILVDPKRVELTVYNSIPHLLTPVITDAKKAILALKWLGKEMERRYNILETEHVRDIASYHENVVAPALEKNKGDEPMPEAMPYIVLIIDELADIMSAYPRELESGIVRLAQMSRAVGIHLILSTQRPSVKVITGLIKANIPARVAFQVASQIDSRTILDTGGAEKLLGAGDMLFLSGEMSKPRRLQAPYTSETEVKRVVAHIARAHEGILPTEIDFSDAGRVHVGTDPIFSSMTMEGDDDDELYGEAKRTVIEAGKASTSYLQRKLAVGYARAARLMDILEERGVIGPADGAKPREVIGGDVAEKVPSDGNESELAQEYENDTIDTEGSKEKNHL